MSVQHDFYSARAADARADAASATLENVRDRFIRSADAWEGMAERVLRTDAARAQRDATKLHATEAKSAVGGG